MSSRVIVGRLLLLGALTAALLLGLLVGTAQDNSPASAAPPLSDLGIEGSIAVQPLAPVPPSENCTSSDAKITGARFAGGCPVCTGGNVTVDVIFVLRVTSNTRYCITFFPNDPAIPILEFGNLAQGDYEITRSITLPCGTTTLAGTLAWGNNPSDCPLNPNNVAPKCTRLDVAITGCPTPTPTATRTSTPLSLIHI